MGITLFMMIISPESSGTYLQASPPRRHLRAIPESEARNPAAQWWAWVRLVISRVGGAKEGGRGGSVPD
jgi:hypothetical protein